MTEPNEPAPTDPAAADEKYEQLPLPLAEPEFDPEGDGAEHSSAKE